MPTRVVVLGAGFGGLELTTILSEAFGDAIDIVLVDKADSFFFGFSKLDVMFGRQLPADAHHAYRGFAKPGVRFLQTTVRSIDPVAKRAVIDGGSLEADILIVALGADLDPAATPGFREDLREPAGIDEEVIVLASEAHIWQVSNFTGEPHAIGDLELTSRTDT